MRWVAALLLALSLGVGALYAVTGGFTSLTAEGARRLSVEHHPRALPEVRLRDEAGQSLSLTEDLARDGRVAIVNFFYTRCLSLCLAQGTLTERLQDTLRGLGLADEIRLISISFDPRDQADDLRRYAQRMGADPALWRFYAFTQPEQAQHLLALFGITVVPAPLGEFEHNAAFHVVTPDGRLARVLDLEEPGRALSTAQALAADSSAGHTRGTSHAPARGAAP